MKENTHMPNQGFTLTEVALALLVIAIGVLAVFALLSSGLDASAKAASDTQAAIFADNVFNALRAQSLQWAETETAINKELKEQGLPMDQYYWHEHWVDLQNGDISIPSPWLVKDETKWVQPDGKFSGGWETEREWIEVWADDRVATYVCTNFSYRTGNAGTIINHALRYSMNINIVDFDTPARHWQDRRTEVSLRVWPGEFGPTNDDTCIVFYSEFDNPGDL